MTIDEAIQRENNIAEENQKIVDTEIVFDDVSLSQLYCDDTEVIEEHLENYKKCVEYHEQIAEWLEELKALRENSNGYSKGDIELNRDAMYKKGYADGSLSVTEEIRGKAIDDFANLIKQRKFDYIEQHLEFDDFVDRLSEQLKEGGENND